MSLYQASTQKFIVPFLVPCAGYFNNVSIKMVLGTESNQWSTAIGKTNPNNFTNELSPGDGEWAYIRSKSDNTVARWDWTDAQYENDVGITYQIYHGYRNKRLYLKSDEMYYFQFEATGSTSIWVTVMADFVPYNNSHFKMTWTSNTLATDSDHNTGFIIPQALQNAILRVYGHVDTNTGEHGTIQFRVADRDDADIDATIFLKGEGVFDTNYGSVSGGEAIASNNVFEVMVGQPNSQGGSNQIDATFPIRKVIHEGDALTYDALQDSSTFTAGDVDLRFTIEGKTFQKNKSNFRSHFVEGFSVAKLIYPGGTQQ